MGALPKKKLSSIRRGKRQAAQTWEMPKLVVCPSCGKPARGHRACAYCGYYKGKPVFEPKETVKVTKVESEKKG